MIFRRYDRELTEEVNVDREDHGKEEISDKAEMFVSVFSYSEKVGHIVYQEQQ